MSGTVRYGVFRLGQIWSVVRGDGRALGFPTRDRALSAAHSMAVVEQAIGEEAELLVQDELGLLTKVSPPDADTKLLEPVI